jgi:hypothetical protein
MGDLLSPSIKNIRDIHAMDIEDVIRLLHEYKQDVEDGIPAVQIKTKFADLRGFPKYHINHFVCDSR